MKTRLTAVVAFFVLLLSGVLCGEPRVRTLVGVAKFDERRYLESVESPGFLCDGGARTVPWERVNDDFCDCDDGADEPGTSACPNGRFWCQNEGFRGIFIPSSRVGDGICDCCDGSDEIDWGRMDCQDKCWVLGEEWRKEMAQLAERDAKAQPLREQYSRDGRRALDALQSELTSVEADLDIKRPQLDALEKEKDKWEAVEADEKLVLARAEEARREEERREDEPAAVEEESDSKVDDAEDAEQFGETEDAMQATEEEEPPPLPTHVNDERDVPGAAGEAPEGKSARPPRTLRRKYKRVGDKGAGGEGSGSLKVRLKGKRRRGGGVLDRYLLNPSANALAWAKELARPPPLVDVPEAERLRVKYKELKGEVDELERRRQALKEKLDIDFGLEREFHPLMGQTFSLSVRDYTYELRPFESVHQKEKVNQNTLGSWTGWVGKDYQTMSYTGGGKCWNGPERSAQVRLQCALENRLVSVDEPNKCTYVLVFETPAACGRSDAQRDLESDVLGAGGAGERPA